MSGAIGLAVGLGALGLLVGYCRHWWTWRDLRVVLLLVLIWACTPANAAPREGGAPRLLLTIAPGDTVRFAFSYTAGARATGALRTVRVPATFPGTSTWVGLPVDNPGPAAATFTGLATSIAADSADFLACVKWTNSGGTSLEVCSAPARWRRRPGQGTVTWDSVVAVRLLPDSIARFAYFPSDSVVVHALDVQQFCPVAIFQTTAALPAGFAGLTECTTLFLAARAAAGWGLASSAQQALADAGCWTLTTTAGTFIGPAKWQARRYTVAELPTPTTRRTALVTLDTRDCGTLPPGTTVGQQAWRDGRIYATHGWLSVVG